MPVPIYIDMVLYEITSQITDYKLVVIKYDCLYLSVKRIARCILSNLELSTSGEVFSLKSNENGTKEKRPKTIGKQEAVP